MENLDLHQPNGPRNYLQGNGARDAVSAILAERRLTVLNASATGTQPIKAPSRTVLPIGSPWSFGGGGGGADSGK